MSPFPRKPSAQTCLVLEALAGAGPDPLYGLEIAARTKLKSGTLYPILARLSDRGLVEGEWLEPERPGRPPRQVYRLSSSGRKAVEALRRGVERPGDLRFAGQPA
jgi:PadR family transcriptional regulator, regulatory protein PadR